MLKELEKAKRDSGESYRRWFSDKTLDLIIWFSIDNNIAGFQLCYRKGSDERALTWFKDLGYSHDRVDEGERIPGHYKMSPILVPDGTFNKNDILDLFVKESKKIDQNITNFVSQKIREYPQG
jgi:hypothetical protein